VQETPRSHTATSCTACVACQWSWVYGILTMRTACLPVEAGDEEGRHALSNAREPLMTVRWHASNVPTGHSMSSQAAQAKRHLLLEPRPL